MKDIEYSQLQARAMQIRDESSIFIEKCRMNIQKAKSLCDDAARLREEAMIIKEECIADKSKAIAILLLISKHEKLNKGRIHASSISEDTSLLLRMIDEVRFDYISEESPLDKLRAELLDLSFLPSST